MRSTAHIYFFRDPEIKGIEICRVEKSHHAFPNHAHDDIYALSLIIGGASYCLGGKDSDRIVKAGEIVLLNPGQVHSGVPIGDNPISYWMLNADIETMINLASNVFEEKGCVPEFKKMILKNKKIAALFHQVLLAFALSQDSLKKESLLNDFLGVLFTHTCETLPLPRAVGNENDAVYQARQYLSQDLDQGLSLDTVARKVGFSQYHFLRLFKKHTGISPHQFRIQCRIQAAKNLIRQGLPFSAIALETGFSDQSHFTNKFRLYTGITPSQYVHY